MTKPESKWVRWGRAKAQTRMLLGQQGLRKAHEMLRGSTHNRGQGLTKEEADKLDEILNRYKPVTEEFK